MIEFFEIVLLFSVFVFLAFGFFLELTKFIFFEFVLVCIAFK